MSKKYDLDLCLLAKAGSTFWKHTWAALHGRKTEKENLDNELIGLSSTILKAFGVSVRHQTMTYILGVVLSGGFSSTRG